MTITRSRFSFCRAQIGGVLYLFGASFSIHTSEFVANTAREAGGAISDYRDENSTGRVADSVFAGNRAPEGGGISWKGSEIALRNVSFAENAAYYGPHIASYGIAVTSRSTQLSAREASGSPISLVFELIDHYEQRLNRSCTEVLRLLTSPTLRYLGNEATFCNFGFFNFSELTIYAPPNSTQVLDAVLEDNQGLASRSLSALLTLAFRECKLGEIWRRDRCENCNAGNFSYSTQDAECSYCLDHAVCRGGSDLVVDPHYWRSSWNSTAIHECPLEDKCLGGVNSTCETGYEGKLCNECSDGFYRFRTNECEDCRNNAALWAQLLLIGLVLLVLFWTAHHIAIVKPSEQKMFILKTVLHHAQFLAVVSPLKISLPQVMRNALHGVTYVASFLVTDLPIACFRNWSPVFVRALIGSAVIPALVAMFGVVCVLAKEWKRSVLVLTTTSLLVSPIITVKVLFPLLSCQSVDHNEENWLFADMREECWKGAHLKAVFALVLPSFILNVICPIGLPAFFAIRSPVTFVKYFPVWHSGYQWSCWDLFFNICKAICFCLVIVSTPLSKLSQLIYGLLILIITCVVNVFASPLCYASQKLFFISEASLVIVAISMGLSSYYIYNLPSSGASDAIAIGLFLILNSGFLLLCGVRMLRNSDEDLRHRPTSSDQFELRAPENSVEVSAPRLTR